MTRVLEPVGSSDHWLDHATACRLVTRVPGTFEVMTASTTPADVVTGPT
jgi:hypothetical protein